MVDVILGVIGTILYPLFSILFVAIDAVQAVFYAFAGIGDIYFGSGGNAFGGTPVTSGNSGANDDTGIVYFLLNNELVKNMFLSIMILAFFLVIIFTVFAFVKNIYSAKPKGWKEIVLNALKGMGNFILVPVLVLLGVWLGNILLVAINGATSSGGATKMSRKLFMASAYNANIYRNENGGLFNDPYEKVSALVSSSGLNITVEDNQSDEYYAEIVDRVYAESNVSIYEWFSVGDFYNLYQINYLVLIVGGIFMLYVLGAITAGMVKRLFMLIILFIISPGICALYPLDEGSAVKSLNGEVKKNILSAYGAVAGMNIFYSILPLIDNIMIGGSGFWAGLAHVGVVTDIVQIFIMVIGLMMVKDIISWIANIIGGGDAFSAGGGLLKGAYGKIKTNTKKALKVGAVAAPYVTGAFRGMRNLGRSALDTTASWFKGAGAAVSNVASSARSGLQQAQEKRKTKKLFNELMDVQDFENNTGTARSQRRGKRIIARRERKEAWQQKIDNAKQTVSSAVKRTGKKIGDTAHDAWEGVKTSDFGQAVGRAGTAIGNAGKAVGVAAKKAGKKIGDTAHDAWEGVKTSDFGQAVGRAGTAIGNAGKKVGAATKKAATWVGDKATAAGKAVAGFAKDQASRVANSEFVTAVKDESEAFAGSAKRLVRDVYEESGMKKEVGEYSEVTSGVKKRREARDEAEKKGKYGVNDAVATAEKYTHLDTMSSSLINALGDKFGEVLVKRLFKGKDGLESLRNTLGLDEQSKSSDLSYLDSVLEKLEHYRERINGAADEKEKEEWINAAKKFAMETDSKGNAQLQRALNEAFRLFSNEELKVDIKNKVEFDTNSLVRGMIEASKKSNKQLAQIMQDFAKELVKEIEAKEKK